MPASARSSTILATRSCSSDTNTCEFVGDPPTGKPFRVPTIAVFFFEDDRITNERVKLDAASMLRQIGRTDLLG